MPDLISEWSGRRNPRHHLELAAAAADAAEAAAARAPQGAATLATLALAHATIAGELAALPPDEPDASPEPHRCYLPTDLSGGMVVGYDHPCGECGLLWRLANITPLHLVWATQRLTTRRNSTPGGAA